MNRSAYALAVFKGHVDRAGLAERLSGKTVLELGPGDSVATAVIAAAYGARAILVDAGRFSASDIRPYLELCNTLEAHGLSPPPLQGAKTIEDVLNVCRARYLTRGVSSLAEIETSSVDFVFSHAVLEHIRKAEFLATFRQIARVLRYDGCCSHKVDLRDHLGGALNNLRFSDELWESEWMASSGFYTNRICFRDMCRAFEESGFQVTVLGVAKWPNLPTPQKAMAAPFRSAQPEELLVRGFDVMLRLDVNRRSTALTELSAPVANR